MMDRNTMLGMWDLLRQRHGIGVRVVGLIPDAQLGSHPIRDMRTPVELVTHMYSLMKSIPEGVVRGEIVMSPAPATFANTAELVKYCEACYDAADAAVQSLTDAQLAATVKTPWGMSFPGWMCFGILSDEYMHHRGQLYVFVRQMGAAPPMMWDFGGNAPKYQPRAQQQA